MLSGPLDRRLTVRRATVSKDAFNADVSSWGDLVTVWASKEEVRDGEKIRAQQVGASITARFQTRWTATMAGVTTSDQLLCEGRLFNITGKKELGRRDGLEFTATAQADA